MSCIPKPKIVNTNASNPAPDVAPAAQGASALKLGVTGDPLDDELLNGRSSGILGKWRLRVGRPDASKGGGSGLASAIVPAGAPVAANPVGFSGAGSSLGVGPGASSPVTSGGTTYDRTAGGTLRVGREGGPQKNAD